ncbi:MAG: hypothetical protein QOE75_1612 [Solirubrobacterales bacterium]|jgi:hypothetical protein|nr:hypothetical protein [Solirubrobacterales bacterium]
MPRKPVSRTAAALAFALLVLATVAAFAYSQREKRQPLVLDRVTIGIARQKAFTPNGDCRQDNIRIRFRTTISDQGTVQVIKPGGRTVLTLARDEFLKRYTFHTYYWDGRQRGGGVARPGRYKLRIRLLGEDRTLVPQGTIRLHRAQAGEGSACEGGSGGVAPSRTPAATP